VTLISSLFGHKELIPPIILVRPHLCFRGVRRHHGCYITHRCIALVTWWHRGKTRHERELRRMSVSRPTINVGNPIYFFLRNYHLGMVEIPHIRIVILGMVCEIGFTTLSSSVGILQNLLSGCIWMIILADLATFTRCKHLASKTRVESLQKLFWVWIYVHVLEVPVSPFKKNRVKHSETPTFHDFSGGVRKSHGGVSHIIHGWPWLSIG
jgi:hypothetical protein